MSAHPVKEGIWQYEGVAPAQVRIEEVDCRPGSGDHEDPEDEREETPGRFFHIAYTAAGGTTFCNGRGYFTSCEEAVREAEKIFGGIEWNAPEA
jgi:hypothetical protein